MTPEHSSRRRYARLTFNDLVTGGVTATHDVYILDLSSGGVRVEHRVVLRPRSSCYLRLPLKPRAVTVLNRVVWSKGMERAGGSPSAPAGLLYQSGLEFGDLAGETRALLTAFLEIVGSPPGDGGPAPTPK